EAVAGQERGLEAALGAGGGGGHARREDARLRVRGERELAVGPLEHHAPQIEAERRVGVVEDRARGGRGVVERLAHADGLRALPGEQEGDHWSRSWLRVTPVTIAGVPCPRRSRRRTPRGG